jgi:hypothetical protein
MITLIAEFCMKYKIPYSWRLIEPYYEMKEEGIDDETIASIMKL